MNNQEQETREQRGAAVYLLVFGVALATLLILNFTLHLGLPLSWKSYAVCIVISVATIWSGLQMLQRP